MRLFIHFNNVSPRSFHKTIPTGINSVMRWFTHFDSKGRSNQTDNDYDTRLFVNFDCVRPGVFIKRARLVLLLN